MQWSPQQAAAITAVSTWLKDKRAPQVFRLFGYAGSGKTTLAYELASGVDGEVLAACFTGKAALVLRRKGMTNASTLHSLIYKPQEDPVTGKTTFVLNPDSALASASLLVVDEVSMVGEELGADVCSFGCKILVLGDPAQLPPIKGEGFFTAQKPNVMLTEIHRQAAENPIIQLSMLAREGRTIRPGTYGETVRVLRRSDVGKDELRSMVLKADQLLCGLNATRRAFNTRMRSIKEKQGVGKVWHPTQGDRLVCLRNNKLKGLLNGSLWDVGSVYQKPSNQWFEIELESADEPGKYASAIVAPQFFEGTEKDMDWRDKKRSDEFDFGYALTVHKSQGSQWDDVLLFDESGAFRDHRRNHQYTGITRAAERLTMVV